MPLSRIYSSSSTGQKIQGSAEVVVTNLFSQAGMNFASSI